MIIGPLKDQISGTIMLCCAHCHAMMSFSLVFIISTSFVLCINLSNFLLFIYFGEAFIYSCNDIMSTFYFLFLVKRSIY